MTPTNLLIVYCLLILLASLAGGWLLSLVRLTHQRMQLAISVVAGFMLGVGLLHLLPHALIYSRSADVVMKWLLAGFLAMFFVERFFCFHHHDPIDHADPNPDTAAHHDHQLTWSGAALGLTLHSLIAGTALAASIESESVGSNNHTPWAGLSIFLMIFLHKPFDSATLSTLMAASHWSKRSRHIINTLFAIAVPIGAGLFYWGSTAMAQHTHDVLGPALAFSAGMFLCIALSDLLPELQFHQHDRYKLSAALLIGLAVAWTIIHFESQTHRLHDNHGATALPDHHAIEGIQSPSQSSE